MEGEPVNRLMGIPLLLISLVAGLVAFGNISQASDMKGWDSVPATVTHGGAEWDSEGGASAFVEYEYVVDGETYRGDTISMHMAVGGEELGEYFHDAEVSGEPISVFVDPEDPTESIFDRDMHWGWTTAQLLVFFIIGWGAIQTFAGKSRYTAAGRRRGSRGASAGFEL